MKAILVIETDAEHIEDLYVEHIWNDYVLIDLGKEYHFKPMPMKMRTDEDDIEEDSYWQGWNECLDEITGETEWTNADALTPSETTGKSILVINTPKECGGCPCLNQKLWECQADKKRRSSDERPSWCPLRPLPSFKAVDLNDTRDVVMFCHGWNTCLADMTGETE